MPAIAMSATVEPGATIGSGTRVWDLTQVRAGARVGSDCVIGRNVFVDAGVVIGDRCKIQNNVLLYHPAVLGDGVFVGPGAIVTNDRRPRAVNPDLTLKSSTDWAPATVTVGPGAALGAGSIVVAGVRVGEWALVAAGAVVVADVPPFSLVAGVPARRIRWVGRTGAPLEDQGGGTWSCLETGDEFAETAGGLRWVN